LSLAPKFHSSSYTTGDLSTMSVCCSSVERLQCSNSALFLLCNISTNEYTLSLDHLSIQAMPHNIALYACQIGWNYFNVLHLDPSHCKTNVHIFPSSVKYNYLYYSLTCFGPLGHLQRQRHCY
jgi:hypothetical protein